MSETRIDVRDLPPAQRHDRILEAFDELDAGDRLVLVNDHEPRPLYYQFKEEVPSFDADGYSVERVADDEFVAELPKV